MLINLVERRVGAFMRINSFDLCHRFLQGSSQMATAQGLSTHKIRIATHLQMIADHPTEHFILENDIDSLETSGWNGGLESAPIGSESAPYTGALRGDGFSISHLCIKRPDDSFVGLFSVIGPDGLLEGVRLTEVTVSGAFGPGVSA